MALPSPEDVAKRIHMACKDEKEEKARLAVCTIARGQKESIECGVLVSDQRVDDLELSEYCIITINEVVHASENKTFKGKYQAIFPRNKCSKRKTLDLQNITKKLVRTTSGLVLIFLNPSCIDLNHGDKKCSILSKSPLSIGSPRHSSPLFCFVENQRYNVVESTGENGEECVDVLKADSKTAKSSSVSPKEIPQGTVILQDDADAKNLMAVGIFKVVNKEHLKISPIWFKSSLNDLLAATPPSSTDCGQTPSTSDTVTATSTTDSGQPSTTTDTVTATSTTDSGHPSTTTDTVAATSTTDSGQPSTTTDTVAAATTDGPQSTVSSGDTPANTTDNQELLAAGSDTSEVSKQLVSEAVTENTLLLEKLSKMLDREIRIINCWKHLADVLEVPDKIRKKCDMYTEHSPTEDLLYHVTNENPYLTVQQLKKKLETIFRNDVIEDLNKGCYKDETSVVELFAEDPNFNNILSRLDEKTMHNYKTLAKEFKINPLKIDQLGMRGSGGPTAFLFYYMSFTEGLKDLTMHQLRKHFEEMKLVKLANVVTKATNEDSDLVKDVVVEGSDVLQEIADNLNNKKQSLKNWRHLAHKLGILREVYESFDTSKEDSHSPTKMMFEWLQQSKPNLTVENLLDGLKRIERVDVVDLVKQEVTFALAKKKKQKSKNDSTQVYDTAH